MTSLPAANELWEGCVFTGVCDSVQEEGRAWQERRPLQRASTGMHSCLIKRLVAKALLLFWYWAGTKKRTIETSKK